VLVTGRLIEESRCVGDCSFTYRDAGTIRVTLVGGPDFRAGDTVTVTTSNNFNVVPVVTVGKTTVALLSNTVSSLTFSYPALPAGSYPVTVSLTGVNAYPILQTTTTLRIGTISSTGSNLGQILSVTGNGFSPITDPGNNVYYICASVPTFIPILTITPTNVTFEIPPNANSACQINVTMKLNNTLTTYTTSAARTPLVSVTDRGSMRYEIIASNNNSRAIRFIVARYLSSTGALTSTVYRMNWVTNSPNNHTATPAGEYLPAGTFRIIVSFDTLGYADSTNNQFTIAPTAINALSPSPTTASFGGQGTFALTATGFLNNDIQNNEVTVCGIRAKVLTADQTGLTF
jgi:hypothetical protein